MGINRFLILLIAASILTNAMKVPNFDMNRSPKVNFKNYEQVLDVIDSHTSGEFCRVVIGGFDEPPGNTMIEKKNYMKEKMDTLRTALVNEPRGHNEMFGAFIVKPVNPEADFGIIFFDSGGYLNMCGHCSIGASTVIVEAGLIDSKEGENELKLEAPSGLIKVKAIKENGKAKSISFRNVPAFVYKEDNEVKVDNFKIPFTISFGGSFFAIVDTRKLNFPKIAPENAKFYRKIGMKMLEIINRTIKVKHPLLDITSVDLIEFYGETPNPDKADMRNAVVFGAGSVDRSPCGTGTSAKLATLYHEGLIEIGEDFRYESIIGSIFIGKILELTKVGNIPAVIPQITGSAYLTGIGKYIIDNEDPFKYGFVVG